MAATADEVRRTCINNKEIEDLHNTVRVREGIIFLPWRWSEDSLGLVRPYGCSLRIGHSYGSSNPAPRSSFLEARATGVNMEAIGIAVSDAVSGVVVPIACGYA